MKKLIFSLIALPLLFAACQKDGQMGNDPKIDPVLKSEIVAQNNSFSLDIFKKITANDKAEDNVFISPLSMYYALNMAGVGANANTRNQFGELLGWNANSDSSVFETMAQLYNDLMPTDSKITFEMANSLWQREGFPVYDNYKANIANWFKGDITEMNFSDPQAVTIINNWIAEKTHDKIKDMLTEISPDAVLFLINAIYFKGDWKYKFDKQYTTDMPFIKVNGETVTTAFMNAKPHIKYASNESVTMISLPYADSAYTMLLMLPDYALGMDAFMQQMTTESIQNWQNQMTYEDVDVSLPKFKFVYGNREISPELKNMGLTDAFNADIADFSNITPEQIYISLVLHKAFIEVNEEGSEAAAATIIGFENTSAGPQDPEFIATRPFIFAICHQPTNTILFIGKVADPSL